tara:strand:- start:1420 stop:2391 length:972 start_codon:yes stop_codon:yes gene_type:complete
MSSILDQAILVGKEGTYGTPATLSRAFEAQADTWQRTQEALESVGMRAGQQTLRSDRRRQINMGAEGSIEMDALSSGLGLLLEGVFGSTTGPTQIGATAAYTSTFATTTDASNISYTIQKLVATNSGVLNPFTYHGAVITDFELSQDVGGFLTVKFDFDSEDEDKSTAAGTPTYPSTGSPFDWTQVALTVAGTPICATSFNFSANMGLKTDRRFLCNSGLKSQPKRAAMPEYTGEINAEFEDTTQYDKFVAGEIFEVTATWTGAAIDTENEVISLTLPACQYDGSTPEASIDDMTMQSLPFKVLFNGTDAAATLAYTSVDTAL